MCLSKRFTCYGNNSKVRKIKVILLHDNARPHVAKIVKETLLKLESEVLRRPDFRSMQDALADTHFFSYEEVQNWMDEWLGLKDSVLSSRNQSSARKVGKGDQQRRKTF